MEKGPKIPLYVKSITLGNILTILTLGAGGVGVYTQIYAEMNTNRSKIVVLEQNEVKREIVDRDTKQEIKQDIRDVRNDVKDLNNKIDKLIYELNRNPKR